MSIIQTLRKSWSARKLAMLLPPKQNPFSLRGDTVPDPAPCPVSAPSSLSSASSLDKLEALLCPPSPPESIWDDDDRVIIDSDEEPERPFRRLKRISRFNDLVAFGNYYREFGAQADPRFAHTL